MTGILNALIAGVSGAVKDAYFNLVSLLLPGNGTNGAQNNTFLDSGTANSGSGFTITRNGNTTQGTFSPFSQTGWGNYFDGSSYLANTSTTSVVAPGTSNFTAEFWVYATTDQQSQAYGAVLHIGSGTSGAWMVSLLYSSAGAMKIRVGTAAADYDSTSTISTNRWYHIAFVREGTGSNQTKIYVDGSLFYTFTLSDNLSNSSALYIGTTGFNVSARRLSGYVSNVRLTVGTALYTGAFTPSTTPLTTTSQGATASQVELLACQSNRFLDNSSNGWVFTTSGSPSVVAFSPFAPTQSYSASAVGGSGYFDGTGDYLEIANNSAFDMGTGNFTAEFYVYTQDQTNSYPGILANSTYNATGAVNIRYDNTGNANKFFVYLFGASPTDPAITSGTYGFNQWMHVALVRDSSTSLKLYINGVLDGSQTISSGQTVSFGSTASTFLRIGRGFDVDGANGYYAGNVSNVRIVKGQALASGNFTPPSAPVTTSAVGWTGANAAGSITGTVSLLLNFTNAGVVDATAKNVLETVGNAQISTTQSKWGGGSISFASASNSNLLGNTPSNWTFLHDGSTWTVEFWLYPTDISSYQGLIATNGAGSTNIGLSFAINAGAISISFTRGVSGSSASFTSSAVLNANQWNYVGVTFTGSTKTCAFFINGASAGSSSNTGFAYSSSTSTYPPYIGQTGSPGFPYYFNGYIDDLRITRGVARTITANPTAPFPVQ
jgi:hypothetical protein